MKNYRTIRMYVIVIISILLMLWVSSCATVDAGIKHESSTGCCSYTIYEDDCLQYESDGYHTTICWDTLENKEQSIEEVQEYCYDNHYQTTAEERAMEIWEHKKLYTNQDIEYILFGEIQE